jgi:hypothetical protein
MYGASVFALLLVLLPSIAHAESSAGCGAPMTMEDGWSVSEPLAHEQILTVRPKFWPAAARPNY